MVIMEKAGEKPMERTIIPGQEAIYLTTDVRCTLHAKTLGVSKT
jgi:hypothetical protein